MTQDSTALARSNPASIADSEYASIERALIDSARGRWFLDEYARRNRNADTLVVLEAIGRVEAAMPSGAVRPDVVASLRDGLADLSQMLASIDGEVSKLAALDLETGLPLPVRRIVGTLRDLRDRVATLLDLSAHPAEPTMPLMAERAARPPTAPLRVVEDEPNGGSLAALMAMTDEERIALFS